MGCWGVVAVYAGTVVVAAMWACGHRVPRLALGVLWCAASACSVYDPDLLPEPPTEGPVLPLASAGGSGGAGGSGTGGAGGTGGTGGASGGSGGGTGGAAGTAGVTTPPPQRPDQCGDGVLAETEVCDTGIAETGAGACPTECPALATCLPQRLEGNGCTTRCVPDPPGCADGDGCCSGDCTADTDDDCSQSCGDGVVQAEDGETCEPDSETDPCPTDCNDDDECTMDLLEGSPSNCNVTCAHVALGLVGDDGCCPKDNPDANANTDNDCTAECGNGVREPGEECDGSLGCDGNCVLTVTAEQQQCLEGRIPTSVDPACEECQCLQCTQLVMDCLFDADMARQQQCLALSDCALTTNCRDIACYCGLGVTACGGILGRPTGPCVLEVEAAAGGTTDPLVITARGTDTTYAIGRANALEDCAATQCPDVCP